MTPLKLIPPVKDYIWGGTRLRDEFGKFSRSGRLAESWELCCHRDGQSIIEGGEYNGKTLSYFLAEHPEALGSACAQFDRFPVLIKLIDAREKLSVQVHPDNDYALAHEGEYGKKEMWYVVDCKEGAELIYGFKAKLTRDELIGAIEDNTLQNKVKRIKVKKGDVFFIEPGTIHAVGEGILLAEIQQNSNITYRVYDYGRTDDNGEPRELHVEKALDVMKLRPAAEHKVFPPFTLTGDSSGTKMQLLGDCEYFTVTKAELDDTQLSFCVDDKSFRHILVISGSGEMSCGSETIRLDKGTSCFIPASSGNVVIKGKCSILNTDINKMEEI